jgi:hypothetical protein
LALFAGVRVRRAANAFDGGGGVQRAVEVEEKGFVGHDEDLPGAYRARQGN